MSNHIYDAFREIGKLLEQSLEKAERLKSDDAVFVECKPLADSEGNVIVKVLGPYKDAEEAVAYLRIKKERFRRNYDRTERSSKNIFGDPDFRYRIMPAHEFFARYLAQISVTALGGLVGGRSSNPEWSAIDDEFETEDSDGDET